MVNQVKHLILYDGQCGFCDRSVQFLLKQDHQRIFYFAPLQGTTAQVVLSRIPQGVDWKNTLVLIENYEDHGAVPIYEVRGKALFRICWLLGGKWSLVGWMSFLPGWMYNWGYRLVANHRHLLVSESCSLAVYQEDKSRFLP